MKSRMDFHEKPFLQGKENILINVFCSQKKNIFYFRADEQAINLLI